MAESTQKLPEELKERYSSIQWKHIAGFRNILVHDYLEGINHDKVWETIWNRLPDLKDAMMQMKRELVRA